MSFLVEGVGTLPGLTLDLRLETTILIELKVGVRTRESSLAVIGAQLILYLVGYHFTTSLCQEILRSKGTSWFTIFPCL